MDDVSVIVGLALTVGYLLCISIIVYLIIGAIREAMGKEPKQFQSDNEPDDVVVGETVDKNDLSIHVIDAAIKRGLKDEYDLVDARYLWVGNYRLNCYKDDKIVDSYFIRFSKEEGILTSEPPLPCDVGV